MHKVTTPTKCACVLEIICTIFSFSLAPHHTIPLVDDRKTKYNAKL